MRPGSKTPQYFACVFCLAYHPEGHEGDCHESGKRWSAATLDQWHGPEGAGWINTSRRVRDIIERR